MKARVAVASVLVALLVAPACARRGGDASLRPLRLRCEYLVDPAAVASPTPRLEWQLEAIDPSARGQRQSAYRVLSASSAEALARNEADLWDSGRVDSSSTHQLRYAGRALAERDLVWWKVQVWDERGRASKWSAPARFAVGPTRRDAWVAEWISMPDNYEIVTRENVSFLREDPVKGQLRLRPARYFRRRFGTESASPVRRATLYASSLGVHRVHLNGERVGDFELAPGWTDYHSRVYYQTHDVSQRIRAGENVLGGVLADGWWAGYVGYGLLVGLGPRGLGREFYGETPALFAQLEIEYADGTTQIVATDSTWKTALGPITSTDILMGEDYDARREHPGWSGPGFDDSDWRGAVAVVESEAPLEPHPGPPIRATQRIAAKRITRTAEGLHIFDLGQNFAGVVELKVSGPAGTRVVLRHGEVLDRDGALVTANLRTARAVDRYTLKGEGVEIWRPAFTYHGFRFVEVRGYPGEPDLDAVTGVVLHSDIEPVGSFESSDPVLDQLYSNIVWTQRSNFFDIPTDCPQRDERLGWTGDAQVFVRAATYNADIAAFATKWLIDLEDAQWEDGAYPNFAPRPFVRPGFRYATAWMDAGVIVPWTLWQVYGDTDVLRRHWAAMEAFMDFRATRDPALQGSEEGMHFGDWLNLDDPTPIAYIDLVYHAYSSMLMAEIAGAIALPERGRHYREHAKRVREAFQRKFVESDGTLRVESQTAHALAIFTGLLDEPSQRHVGRRLAAMISDRGGKMRTGFLGTRALLPALTRSGQHALAGQLLQATHYPSWGYEVVNGATSIWERWNSYTREGGVTQPEMNSFSHYAFGAVGEWMFQQLAGIELGAPGWREIRIQPKPTAGLDWVRAHYDSPRGRIATSWKIEDGRLALEVGIPPNTVATIRVPTSAPDSITESGAPVAGARGLETIEPGLLRAQAGRYRFRAAAP